MSESTIAAIATPLGTSGIGMIRLSGPQAIKIAAGMMRPAGKANRDIERMKGYTGLYGRVFDEQGDVDDAVLFVYRAPRSYTGEDTVEICCHGGQYLLERTLRRCFVLGAVPAGPGEFTRRAYMAGKLSLTQAEAVASLIASNGQQAAAAALAARDGSVNRRIGEIRDRMVRLSAGLAAWIDYPEEEQEAVFSSRLENEVLEMRQDLLLLLQGYEKDLNAREGIATVIIGKPNVGKSSLMNLLTGEDTSIVTDVAGTTRDVVESRVMLGGLTLRLWDTAGIRQTEDAVEAVGVERARNRLERAQLVLAVLDGSCPMSGEDRALLQELKGKPSVAVVNKNDLGVRMREEEIAPYVQKVVRLSARTGGGIQELETAIRQVLQQADADPSAAVLQGERQASCAREAEYMLGETLDALRGNMTLDAVNVCLDGAIDALLSLTGERAGEAVVNEVFARFCVGK